MHGQPHIRPFKIIYLFILRGTGTCPFGEIPDVLPHPVSLHLMPFSSLFTTSPCQRFVILESHIKLKNDIDSLPNIISIQEAQKLILSQTL